uniref:Uncharacterized protein n=1 Tax=Salix viminalis TaxID=40686 RepID=A0A6N2MWC2_SALVM
MITSRKKACSLQFPQLLWHCTDCPLNLISCKVRKLTIACRRRLIHLCMTLQQTLDVMTMHMTMRMVKQVPTICMVSLKAASKENMTRRNGKTSLSHPLQDHMIWELIHLMDTTALGLNKMY